MMEARIEDLMPCKNNNKLHIQNDGTHPQYD